MSRQNLLAAAGLFVVALLIAVTLYVSNLKAADAAPAKKPTAAPTGADQIKQLQARIESLEKRLATLEKERTNTWEILPINPQSTPPLKYIPGPTLNAPGNDGEREKDGFPKARTILINGDPWVTKSSPAR